MYIASVIDRKELDQIIEDDPFSALGLIDDFQVLEWKPFVGVFASEIEHPVF